MVNVATPTPGARKFMMQVYRCVKVYCICIHYARCTRGSCGSPSRGWISCIASYVTGSTLDGSAQSG